MRTSFLKDNTVGSRLMQKQFDPVTTEFPFLWKEDGGRRDARRHDTPP